MALRPLFKSQGTEKEEKKRIARQHKLKEGEERKVLWQLKRTFGVSRSEGGELYLYVKSQRWITNPMAMISWPLQNQWYDFSS